MAQTSDLDEEDLAIGTVLCLFQPLAVCRVGMNAVVKLEQVVAANLEKNEYHRVFQELQVERVAETQYFKFFSVLAHSDGFIDNLPKTAGASLNFLELAFSFASNCRFGVYLGELPIGLDIVQIDHSSKSHRLLMHRINVQDLGQKGKK